FNILRDTGFIFPDDESKIKKSYKRLVDYKIDLNQTDLYNNSSIGTDICRYFCAESFYNSTEQNKPTLIENFNDDEKLKKVIGNRLGLDWIDVYNKGPGLNFAFNLSFKMIIQGMRSMRMVPSITMFKPEIAKFICLKYSNPGDL